MRKIKDSGIEELGKIPRDWNVKRIKNAVDIIRGGSPRPIEEFISNTEDGYNWIKIGDTDKNSRYITHTVSKIIQEGLSKTRLVYPGTLLLTNSMSFGEPYILQITGCIHDGWVAFFNYRNIDKFFLYYLLLSASCRSQFEKMSDGGVVQNLNIDKIGNCYISVPESMVEQRQIISFLDGKCSEIDKMTANLHSEIDTLEKYKRSVITEAVTKGLDENIEMKDSGISCIGNIPRIWKIARLKYVCSKITDGSHFSPTSVDEGYPYITAKDIHGITLDFDKALKISEPDYVVLQRMGCQPERGDVLIVKDGATTGRTGMMLSDKKCVVLSSVAMLHGNEYMNNFYLWYYLQSASMQEQIQLSMAGSAMPRITLEKLNNFIMTVPDLLEQQRIVKYLDSKCSDIDTAIVQKQRQLDILNRYKKSLIYEYVTGKKEVPSSWQN